MKTMSTIMFCYSVLFFSSTARALTNRLVISILQFSIIWRHPSPKNSLSIIWTNLSSWYHLESTTSTSIIFSPITARWRHWHQMSLLSSFSTNCLLALGQISYKLFLEITENAFIYICVHVWKLNKLSWFYRLCISWEEGSSWWTIYGRSGAALATRRPVVVTRR